MNILQFGDWINRWNTGALNIKLEPGLAAFGSLLVDISMPVKCVDTGIFTVVRAREPFFTECDEWARKTQIREIVRRLMSHEMDEQLTFDGVRIFNPHGKVL